MKQEVIPRDAKRPVGDHRSLFIVSTSFLLLLPCVWQPRIQAGDLSSHIYNAWLAQLISAGQTKALVVVPQTTNTLFDLVLSGLFRSLGPAAAQRIAVSAAVLVFAWGAFAFVAVTSGRWPRDWFPGLAIFAYGWVFHSGFFNFYLSLGLCFLAAALAWAGKPRGCAIAAGVLAVAWAAHILPVLWTVSIVGYAWIARRVSSRQCALLFVSSLAALVVLHGAVRLSFFSIWNATQFRLVSGADQAWVFDDKYLLTAFGLGAVFFLLLLESIAVSGFRRVVSAIPFQIWALTAAAVAAVPATVAGHGWQAAFISDRMSLPSGICLLAAVSSVRMRTWQRYGLMAVALLFFGFLYRDSRILNAFEDELQAAVATLPPGQRVVSGMDDPDLHINALTHTIDRVCVGRCFSYANYEASTGQFRIRVRGPNALVAATYADSWRLQNGRYRVIERDLPLYEVTLNQEGKMEVQSLRAGQITGMRYWKALPDLF